MGANKYNQLRIIGGKWRSRIISFVELEGLRPTPDRVRETLFNWLHDDVPEAQCLDLFAGSGALGFEAASRGARRVTMVDNSNAVCKTIQENIIRLSADSVEIVTLDAVHYLENNKRQYDVVFVDPPYTLNILPQILLLLEQKKSLSENAKIYLEHDVKHQFPELPENWQVLKNKTAGQVSYYLIDRKNHKRVY